LARALGRREGEMFGWPEGSYESLGIDQLNNRFHELSREWPLEDVRAEFAASYDQLVEAVQGMDEAELARLWLEGHADRGAFEQRGGAEALPDLEGRLRLLPAAVADHDPRGPATEWGVHGEPVVLHRSPDQREVPAPDGVGGQQLDERSMRVVVLGHDEKPGR